MSGKEYIITKDKDFQSKIGIIDVDNPNSAYVELKVSVSDDDEEATFVASKIRKCFSNFVKISPQLSNRMVFEYYTHRINGSYKLCTETFLKCNNGFKIDLDKITEFLRETVQFIQRTL